MNRSENAKRGIISGILNNILKLFLPFLSRTVVLYILGVAYLGIGGLFTSLLQVLNISELGFGTTLSFLLYKPIAENDTEKIRAILAFSRKCFRYIGIVVLALGLAVMPFIRNIINGDVPDGVNIYMLYLFYLVDSVSSYFLFSYKKVLLSALQRYDIESLISSGLIVLQSIFQIIVLLLWKNYYIFVLILVLSTIINNLICQLITKKKYPQYYCEGEISDEDIALVKKTVKGVFISKIGFVGFTSVNNIIISSFFGLVLLGQYSNYYYVTSCIVGFFAIIHNALRPILGNYVLTETKESIYDMLTKVLYFYNWTTALCTGMLLCLYQDFIQLWAGEDNMLPMSFVIMITLAFFTGRIPGIPSLFIEAKGLYAESQYVNLIAGVLNLSLGILFSKIWGLNGLMASLILANVLICFGGYIIVMFRVLFRDKNLMILFLKSIATMTLIQILYSLLTYKIVSCLFAEVSIMIFIGKAFLSFLVFMILFGAYSFFQKEKTKAAFSFMVNTLKR